MSQKQKVRLWLFVCAYLLQQEAEAEGPFVATGVQDGRRHLWELHDRGKTLLMNRTRQASIKGTRKTRKYREKNNLYNEHMWNWRVPGSNPSVDKTRKVSWRSAEVPLSKMSNLQMVTEGPGRAGDSFKGGSCCCPAQMNNVWLDCDCFTPPPPPPQIGWNKK